MPDRLKRQFEFLIEIDKMKQIFRKTRLYDHTRYENDAEHGWHMAMMALVLAEHSNNRNIDIGKVIKMALIHDIVEIDAGDTFLYAPNQENKHEVEATAAKRIFGLLPDNQRDEFIALWEEFEARETSEAMFARAIDRLGPVMQNLLDNGHAWKNHGITSDRVFAVNSIIDDGSHGIWELVHKLLGNAIENGDLSRPA